MWNRQSRRSTDRPAGQFLPEPSTQCYAHSMEEHWSTARCYKFFSLNSIAASSARVDPGLLAWLCGMQPIALFRGTSRCPVFNSSTNSDLLLGIFANLPALEFHIISV